MNDVRDAAEFPKTEVVNVKFPNFDNKGLSQGKEEKLTKEKLINNLNILINSLGLLLLKLDKMLNKYDSKISKEMFDIFKNSKMDIINLRVGFLFFYRKLNIFLDIIIKGFTVIEEEHSKDNIDQSIKQVYSSFIAEHSCHCYIDDIDMLRKYFNSFSNTEQSMIKMIKNLGEKYQTSITVFCILTDFIIGIIEDSICYLNKIKDSSSIKNVDEVDIVKFLFSLHQIDVLNQIFENFYLIKGDSLWDIDENDERWINLKKHYNRIVAYSREEVKAMLNKLVEFVYVGYASVSKGYEKGNNEFIQKAMTGMYMAYYFINKKESKTQSMKFLINPNGEVSQTIWNMMDAKGFKSAIKVILPGVKYSKKWYLKRIEKEITLDEILKISNSISTTNNDEEKIEDKNSLLIDKGPLNPEEINDLIKDKVKDKTQKFRYVKVKIIHTDNLRIKTNNLIGDFINTCCSPAVNNTRDTLIIHIHGGGFISMSPSSHENYTRKWVNALRVPCISIAYSLSPQFPFPKALDDVYQAYTWIMRYAKEILNINLNKIIIVGDSAGGNLVLSLVSLLIIKKKRIPDALFLAYPALKLSMKELNLSYLNCLTDPILEYSLLRYCLVSYSGKCDEYNPFLSPLFMDDKILKQLPKVRIFGGSCDPLRDDSILLLDKLVRLGVDVHMTEFKYFPHGFLNYDIPLMMPEAGIANKLIIEEMEKIISSKINNNILIN